MLFGICNEVTEITNSNSLRHGYKVFYLKHLDIRGKYINFETEIK